MKVEKYFGCKRKLLEILIDYYYEKENLYYGGIEVAYFSDRIYGLWEEYKRSVPGGDDRGEAGGDGSDDRGE